MCAGDEGGWECGVLLRVRGEEMDSKRIKERSVSQTRFKRNA